MSKAKTFALWCWLRNEEPFYVGWSKWVPGGTGFLSVHPAERMFLERFVFNSKLHAWLRTLETEPTRHPDFERLGLFHKAVARSMCVAKREDFERQGFELISSRDVGTFNGGGGARKVIGPNKFVFKSVRHAAEHAGVDNSTMTRWCQSRDKGWRYHEELVTHENQT